jgi:hypothetical protein
MITIKLRLFGSLLAAGVTTLVVGMAQAFEITQPIRNTNETACVDVFKGNTSNGTIIQAYPCTGGKNEQWTLVNGLLEGTGNDAGVATCMVASGVYTGNVELENCNPNIQTPWVFGVGSISIDGEEITCLDSQGKYGAGAQLVLVECSGVASQQWELRDIVIVQSRPGTNEHACVDVRGNYTANNTPVDA